MGYAMRRNSILRSLAATLIASALLGSCNLLGKSDPPTPAAPKFAFTSFSAECDWASYSNPGEGINLGGPQLIFDWAMEGEPDAYELWMSTDQNFASVGRKLREFDAKASTYYYEPYSNRAWIFLSEIDPKPQGYRWLILVARDRGANADDPLDDVVATRATAVSFAQVDSDPNFEPVVIDESAPVIDRAFWGHWYRLDLDQSWYIGDRLVYVKTYIDWARRAELDESATSSTKLMLRGVSDGYGTTDYSVSLAGENVLRAHDERAGKDIYFHRSGKGSLAAKGDLKSSVSISALARLIPGLNESSRALVAASGINLVISNVLNASDVQKVDTANDGVFAVGGLVPDSTYEIQPLIQVGPGGSIVRVRTQAESNSPSVPVKPLHDGQDLGTVTISDKVYQYKTRIYYDCATGFNDPGYYSGTDAATASWFLPADPDRVITLNLDVENPGLEHSPPTKFRLSSPDGALGFGDAGTDTSVTLGPATIFPILANRLPFKARIRPSALPGLESRGYADISIRIDITNDEVPEEGTWEDRAALRVYRDDFLGFKARAWNASEQDDAEIRAAFISPEGYVNQAYGTGSFSASLPLLPSGDEEFLFFIKGPAEGELKYSFNFGGEPEPLSADTRPQSLNEGNGPDSPRYVYAQESFTGLIKKGENAFFRLVGHPQAPIEGLVAADPADPATAAIRLSWSGAESTKFRITRESSEGSPPVVFETTTGSFTDTGAAQGKAYSYTVMGFNEAKGWTRPSTVSSYLSPWKRDEAFVFQARPELPSAQGSVLALVDEENKLLWTASQGYTTDAPTIFHPGFLQGIDVSAIASGAYSLASSRELPLEFRTLIGLALGPGGLPVLAYDTGAAFKLASPDGSGWRTWDLSGLSASLSPTRGGSGLGLAYDPAGKRFYLSSGHRVVAFPDGAAKPTDADATALEVFDATLYSADAKYYPRQEISRIAAAPDGRLFVACTRTDRDGNYTPTVTVAIVSFSASGAKNAEKALATDSNYLYTILQAFSWTSGGLAYALKDEGGFPELGLLDPSSLGKLARGRLAGNRYMPFSGAGFLGGELHFAAPVDGRKSLPGGYSQLAPGEAAMLLRVSDGKALAIAAETGLAPRRIMALGGGGFTVSDEAIAIRYGATGSYIGAFSPGPRSWDLYYTGFAWGDSLLVRDDGTGRDQWISPFIYGLRANEAEGWAAAPFLFEDYLDSRNNPRLELYASRGSSAFYSLKKDDMAGEMLHRHGADGSKSDSREFSAATLDLRASPDGSLSSVYAGASWATTVSRIASASGFLAAEEALAVDASTLDILGRRLAGSLGGTLADTTPLVLSFSRPLRDASGRLYLLATGSWNCSYRPPYKAYYLTEAFPFAFVLEIDAKGSVAGLIGGPSRDFPELGAAILDFDLDASGRLLVLREGGKVDRYERR